MSRYTYPAKYEESHDSLSTDDIETDSAPVTAPRMPEFQFQPIHPAKDERKMKLEGRSDEVRFDSGYGLSLTGSTPASLSSMNSLKERGTSVTSRSRPIPDDLTSAFEKLLVKDVKEDDEGIHSLVDKNEDSDFSVDGEIFAYDLDMDNLLHVAIICGDRVLARALIDLVQNLEGLDLQNRLFQTPLHLAVSSNQADVVKKLVMKGADVTCKDHRGNTPLHVACEYGNEEILQALFGSPGVVQAMEMYNFDGHNCLHVAARGKRSRDMCQFLLSKGADVNARDSKNGRTVLHFAAESKNMDLVNVLLKADNVDVDCDAYDGKTPLYLAYWRNHQDIVRKLVKVGAYFDYETMDEFMDSSDDES